MKIVAVDNFNRDEVSDVLIAENVHEAYAEKICEFLNSEFCNSRYSPRFFKVKPDTYKLYIWEP
jgi:hypothetical protein